MSIRGSLETLSLPELLQIIGTGNKSGRLTFNPSHKNNDDSLKASFELWFKNGDFITIVNSLKYQALIEKIQKKAWIDSQVLVKTKYSCPKNKPLGTYLQEKKLLEQPQLDLLFTKQIIETNKLFNVQHAWFKFEEVDPKHKIVKDGETFPWMEMTGNHKQATELSLEAMRDLSDWSRFTEEMPPEDMGLQKVIPSCNIQLTHIEQNLWDMADGLKSLKKIAQEQARDLKTVQYTALSMIFAGLVEEVPVISTQGFPASFSTKEQLNLRAENNTGVQTKSKTKVSNSLINNLVKFFKDNF